MYTHLKGVEMYTHLKGRDHVSYYKVMKVKVLLKHEWIGRAVFFCSLNQLVTILAHKVQR